MSDRFSRTQLLLGPSAMDILSKARVAVFGIGGVGGYVVEALVRSGIGAIDIIDKDIVDITNINRQIIAVEENIGLNKVDVMAQRIHSINPQCQVSAHHCFYLPDTKDQFDLSEYDYVVDAVDTITAKLLLIEEAHRCKTPIISSMGAANKIDPTAFEVSDIYKTSICPLAKIIRKECRKRGIDKFKVVYSKEPVCETYDNTVPDENDATYRPTPGSVAFVPPVVGLIIAGEVVKDLVGINGEK